MGQMNTQTDSEKNDNNPRSSGKQVMPAQVPLPLELRVHGRGGQGGVTCAKLCALVYSNLGLYAQTFGDYGMERAGAPVRAYTRVDRNPITNRNKVYTPDHLLVLDPSLFGEGILDGVHPGSLILLNTGEDPSAFQGMRERFQLATVNATEIARRHGIGTSAVIIVNTAIVGAYARLVDLPISILEETYSSLGLQNDLRAAQDAYHAVVASEIRKKGDRPAFVPTPPAKPSAEVIALTDHTCDMPTPLKTGSWRTQSPLYRAGQAPCNAACLAGNDVVGFVQALRQDGSEAAARLLLNTQPLPSVCGRVCPAPCMTTCNRASHDGAVNIRGLERWVGDHATEHLIDVHTVPTQRNVAIVGGGPAGLAAGFAFIRAGHDVTIYDSQPRLGGVLRSAIPSYRLPNDALDRDINRILGLGLKSRLNESLDAQRVRDLASAHDAVVLATGQARSKALDSSGIALAGVEQGLKFLHRVKARGVEKLQGTVIVVGGGNTAVDCARTALRCGAEKVTIVYRRGSEEMPAIHEEIEEAIAEGVGLMAHRQPVRFTGDRRVTGIELAEVELGDPDSSGRKRPIVTDRLSVIPCDHVLLALGQGSDLGILPPEWIIEAGRVHISDEPINAWLAGDLSTGAGTVAHAVAHGRKVAHDILNALGDQRSDEAAGHAPALDVVKPENLRLSHFPFAERHQDSHLPTRSRISGFQEVNLGLADTEEAERCFSCGHCTQCDTCLTYCPEGIISRGTGLYVINEEYCKGCGICVWECPRHAMQMTAEGYRSRP
jgi:2-oxoacid:acceptor oxidoreductase gamma subunit (pyruvate/2-ketoisovalerate family)